MQKYNAFKTQHRKKLGNVGFRHEFLDTISKVQSMKE